MKTIALISTFDTKQKELDYAREFILSKGLNVLTIDISTRPGKGINADISPFEVIQEAGFRNEQLTEANSKAQAIEIMRLSLCALLPKLISEGRIHGVLGLGGVQNSLINSSAMQLLPIGIPKVLLSTIASGFRTCGSLVGSSDITLLPSIADFTGINSLTALMIRNAASAVIGMVEFAGEPLKNNEFAIGATLMGATEEGILRAIHLVEDEGYQVIAFHSTGVGGIAMEKLIESGSIRASMDLCLHEIIAEDVFNLGFSKGAKNRLKGAVKMNIPLVLSPAGLDFIDVLKDDFFNGVIGDPNKRKFTMHNKNIVHVKVFPAEAVSSVNIVCERLKNYSRKGAMVIPLKGLRTETKIGENLFDPEVDNAIFEELHKNLPSNIEIIELDAHISDPIFSETVANTITGLIGEL